MPVRTGRRDAGVTRSSSSWRASSCRTRSPRRRRCTPRQPTSRPSRPSSLKREHVAIIAGIDALRDATGAGGIAAAAGGVEALFDVHLEKENELILPALLDAPAASLAQLLRGMHALLGAETDPNRDPDKDAEQDAQSGGCGCGGCGCGGGSQQR